MKPDFPKNEEKILKFWKEKKIFEKSLEKTKKGPRFVFYEGPPFANGLPGIHHLLSRAFKDIILRYKTMQGFYVERKAGWDTHGLPTEMEAERKLGVKTKKDIEKVGIEKFIEECRKNVFTYKKEWEEFTERIGYWLDLENAYITCDSDYIESLWWILKQIWEKGLLYQDYKVVPYCPRCGTSLSSHEVAQGYKKIKENSIYIKFKVKEQKDTYFLVWTTTPWTLPGNVAVAINPKFTYAKVKVGNEYLILAKERLNVLGKEYEVVDESKGKDLLSLEYESLHKIKNQKGPSGESATAKIKSIYKVIGADFVSLEEGTGLVHIAPAFGEEDMEVVKGLPEFPVLLTVDEEGKMKTPGYKWHGMFVKDADSLIVEDLKKRNLLYKEEIYEHGYPFCWRCDSPLLYYAKTSWFIKVTKVKEELIKNNKQINWIPGYLKEGRFGEWLRGVKDWNLSRERYWGTPLPMWQCKKCKKQVCVGSKEELKKLQIGSQEVEDLHRPYIDKVILKCECGGEMRRVPEVIDCWFDSGSMPFAQWHYPFENKERIEKGISFPADFICEGIDQTRGWFYTLLAISTLLDLGPSYKNVISHGIVLDAKGQKMSKSKGNVIIPSEVMDKFGADCARFYFYIVNPVAEPKRFDFKAVQDLSRRFFGTLRNSYIFFSTYTPREGHPEQDFEAKKVLDQWIISRLHSLNKKLIENLDKYYIVEAARLFEDFVDDLSNWYIRRSRQRFQRPETSEIKKEASQTLHYVLLRLSKLIAPFTPFIAEELYQNLSGPEESVHLSDYLKPDKKLINLELEEKMRETREIIAKALNLRAEAGIKVRQPLLKLKIQDKKGPFGGSTTAKVDIDEELLDLIKEEVNIKGVVFDSKIRKEMELDTEITEELEKEGKCRELLRNAKDLRKKLGLSPGVVVTHIASTVSDVVDKDFLKQAGAKKFINVREEEEMDVDVKKEIKLGEEKHYIGIKK